MKTKASSPTYRFIAGIALASLSGAMLLFSFQPYGMWYLAWIALVPMLLAQYRFLPPKWSSLAPALGIGIWLGFFLGRLFGPDFGPFFQYLGVLIGILNFFLAKSRNFHELTGYRYFVLFGILDWVGFEMIRATIIPLVATNGFIGYTQATQPWLIQPISIFSIYGLDLLIMLVNFALAQGAMNLIDRKWEFAETVKVNGRSTLRWLAASALVLVAWVVLSVGIYTNAPEPTSGPRVASLRPNYPKPAFQDEENTSDIRLETVVQQVREAAGQGAEIMYTPEMVFNFDPQVENTETLRALAQETDAYLFISYTVALEGEPFRNEVVLLTPEGEFLETYAKNHAPPGEPLSPSAGRYPVYETPLGTLSTMICHDTNYTDVARKLTRNGSQLSGAAFREFGGYGEQMWTHVVFRAVENRSAMVVTGVANASAIIDPYGNVLALDVDAAGSSAVLVENVSLGMGGTPYLMLGDLLGWLSLAGYIGLMVFQSRTEKNAKEKQENCQIKKPLN